MMMFNSIQFKIVYFQNNTYSTYNNVFAYDVLKRERAEDIAYVGSFTIMIQCNINIYNYTQLLIGDNYLNNHNDIVLAMLLQSCKYIKTRNSCRIY